MEKGQYVGKREATHDRILCAAIELFAKNGLGNTSIKDIAKLAGASVGLMYHYYKTKEEVFGALVKMSLEEMQEIDAIFDSGDCALKILTRLCEEVIGGLEASYEFAQWSVMFSHPLPKKHDKEWADAFVNYHNKMIGLMTSLIKRGQKEGKFKKGDAAMLAQHFIATLDGLCTLQLSQKDAFIVPSIDTLVAAIVIDTEELCKRK